MLHIASVRKAEDPAFRVVTNLRNRVYSAVRAARAGKKNC